MEDAETKDCAPDGAYYGQQPDDDLYLAPFLVGAIGLLLLSILIGCLVHHDDQQKLDDANQEAQYLRQSVHELQAEQGQAYRQPHDFMDRLVVPGQVYYALPDGGDRAGLHC